MAARTIPVPDHFRPMPPEPWGRRLARARMDVAGLTADQAAVLVGHWMLTTQSTITRLEGQHHVPTGPRARSRRQLAYVLCLAYEVDPAEFGLSPDDLPPGLKIPPRTHEADGSTPSTNWYRDNPSVRPLRIVA